MCDVIKSHYVLANLLLKHPSISIKQLKDIERKIEAEMPFVYIDVSMSSLCISVERYPRMFSMKEDIICRTENSEKYFVREYIENNFNYKLPKKIKEYFTKTLSAA